MIVVHYPATHVQIQKTCYRRHPLPYKWSRVCLSHFQVKLYTLLRKLASEIKVNIFLEMNVLLKPWNKPKLKWSGKFFFSRKIWCHLLQNFKFSCRKNRNNFIKFLLKNWYVGLFFKEQQGSHLVYWKAKSRCALEKLVAISIWLTV